MNSKITFDRSALALISVIWIISILTLAFKFVDSGNSCPDIEITASSKTPEEGSVVTFSFKSPKVSGWDWDFGDKTPHDTSGTGEVKHTYAHSGLYMLSLTVNGKCTSTPLQIDVKPLLKAADDTLPDPVITGPITTAVGKSNKFTENSTWGTAWEWQFGESGKPDRNQKTAYYTFQTAGPKKVQLTVTSAGGVPKIAYLDVTVEEGVPGGEGSIPAGNISEGDFAKMLDEVVKRKKDHTAFEQLLCGNIKVPVIVDGKDKPFVSYCNDLRNSNSITTIQQVEFIKNPTTKCITGIKVQQKTGKWAPWRK